jgi:hypothetical protein
MSFSFPASQSANDAGGNAVRSHDNCQAAVKTGAKQGFLLAEGRRLREAREAKVRPS